MGSRSRSPIRRNGESCVRGCSYRVQGALHNPGPELPLPDREKQKRTVINPHGVRPALTQTCPIDEVIVPRYPGEGKKPIFGFLPIPRVVVVDEGPRRDHDRRRDYDRREDRRDDRRDQERRDLERRDLERRDLERRDLERRDLERREKERRRDRDQKEGEKKPEETVVKTEATETPVQNQRRLPWRPPMPPFPRYPMYPPPMGYPPYPPFAPPRFGPPRPRF